MMKNEGAFRRWVVKALRPLDAFAVERVLVPEGFPDVCYADGLIELKWLPRWPVRGGVVKLDHFTNEQRILMRKRAKVGGQIWGLLLVGDEVLLFDGHTACRTWGRAETEDMRRLAHRRWDKPNAKELLEAIKEGVPA